MANTAMPQPTSDSMNLEMELDMSRLFGLDTSQNSAMTTHIVPANSDIHQEVQAGSNCLGTLVVPSSPCAEECYGRLDDSEDFSFFDRIARSNDLLNLCDMTCDPESHSELFHTEEPINIKDEPVSPAPSPTSILDEPLDIPVAPDAKIDGDGEFVVHTPAKGKALYTRPVDATDRMIQRLFPEWTLRLERNQFNAWKKKSGVRKLNPRENDLLKKYRRTMLARVYADRARHRRAAKHGAATSKIDKLFEENARLRQRVSDLERKLGIGR